MPGQRDRGNPQKMEQRGSGRGQRAAGRPSQNPDPEGEQGLADHGTGRADYYVLTHT